MTPGISTIIKVGLTTRYNYNVLESFRLQAEGARRSRGQRPFEEILFSSESVIKVLDGEVENVFRHISLDL